MNFNPKKIALILIILIFSIFLDQITKIWANNNLASPRYPDHHIEIMVQGLEKETSLKDFIDQKYPNAPEEERDWMLRTTNITIKDNPIPPLPSHMLKNGDLLLLKYHTINVIPNYWDFIYARNPGAAWSFLADADENFRKYFFGITSFIALILLTFFLLSAKWPQQRLMIISLAFVMGGALGNLIDRFNYGYVIDFISWHIADKYAWPTFNLADVFITVGAAFLIIDLFVNAKKHNETKQQQETNDPKTTSA